MPDSSFLAFVRTSWQSVSFVRNLTSMYPKATPLTRPEIRISRTSQKGSGHWGRFPAPKDESRGAPAGILGEGNPASWTSETVAIVHTWTEGTVPIVQNQPTDLSPCLVLDRSLGAGNRPQCPRPSVQAGRSPVLHKFEEASSRGDLCWYSCRSAPVLAARSCGVDPSVLPIICVTQKI